MKYLVLVLALTGCSVAPTAEVKTTFVAAPPVVEVEPEPVAVKPVRDPCPPLPELRDGSTRFAYRLYVQTIIALYAQCARGE